MELINWKIVSHPINWVVLFLMIVIASLFMTFVLSAFKTPETA